MDAPKAAVRFSVLAVAGVLVAIAVISTLSTPPTVAQVRTKEGDVFVVPSEAGVYPAIWAGTPVTVYAVPQARLDGVERLRGDGEATEAISLPGDLSLFALSAKSTHMGCTVGWNTGLGASKDIADYDGDGFPDGRVLDPCHHGQWDACHRGVPMGGTPTHDRRLAALQLEVHGAELWGTGFDGPIGPP